MAISEVCWKGFFKKIKLYLYTWIRFKVFRLPGTWMSGYSWVFVLSPWTIRTPLCTTSSHEYLTNQVAPLFIFVFCFFVFFFLIMKASYIHWQNLWKDREAYKKKCLPPTEDNNLYVNIFWIIVFQIFFFLSLSAFKVDKKCVIFSFNDFARVKKLAAT